MTSAPSVDPSAADQMDGDDQGPRATRMPREQRREQVLTVARGVFVERGYHAAGMDEIAEAAGVSKPVVYQHFPSKLELYLALLDRGIEELLGAADAALASTSDNKERVQATMRAYFSFVADRDSAYRLVFESDVMNESAVRERVNRAHEAIAAKIAEVISTDTGLSNDQAMLLGSGLQGLAQVAATRWLTSDQTQMPLEEAADLVSALAWRGIRSFPLSHPPE